MFPPFSQTHKIKPKQFLGLRAKYEPIYELDSPPPLINMSISVLVDKKENNGVEDKFEPWDSSRVHLSKINKKSRSVQIYYQSATVNKLVPLIIRTDVVFCPFGLGSYNVDKKGMAREEANDWTMRVLLDDRCQELLDAFTFLDKALRTHTLQVRTKVDPVEGKTVSPFTSCLKQDEERKYLPKLDVKIRRDQQTGEFRNPLYSELESGLQDWFTLEGIKCHMRMDIAVPKYMLGQMSGLSKYAYRALHVGSYDEPAPMDIPNTFS